MKKRNWFRFGAGLSAVVLLLFSVSLAETASFPSKPIRLINPSAAGGSTDLNARAIASVTHTYLGQPMIVQLMPGGGGKQGVLKVVRSKPDGHTVLFTSGSHTTISPIVRKLGYDTRKDLIPIFQTTESPYMMVSMASKPWKNFKEFVAAAKKNPGKVSFGSNSIYGNGHLMILKIMADMNIKLGHVPFKGGGPALRAMMGGHVDSAAALPATGAASSLIKKGKMNLLAVAADQRIKEYPNAPIFKELGVDFRLYVWRTFFVPAGTPKERIDILVEGLKKVMKDKTYRRLAGKMKEKIIPLYGPKLVKKFNDEYARHEAIFRSMGIVKK
jgi:tripartite-type tricarboxylate transporter receptor subunit TctC